MQTTGNTQFSTVIVEKYHEMINRKKQLQTKMHLIN